MDDTEILVKIGEWNLLSREVFLFFELDASYGRCLAAYRNGEAEDPAPILAELRRQRPLHDPVLRRMARLRAEVDGELGIRHEISVAMIRMKDIVATVGDDYDSKSGPLCEALRKATRDFTSDPRFENNAGVRDFYYKMQGEVWAEFWVWETQYRREMYP
jgi:hypothetical protein